MVVVDEVVDVGGVVVRMGSVVVKELIVIGDSVVVIVIMVIVSLYDHLTKCLDTLVVTLLIGLYLLLQLLDHSILIA